MHRRKLSGFVVTMLSTVFVVGLVIADEKSKTHLAMEKIQIRHTAILKTVKNAANFKKGQKDVVTAAEEISKIAKTVRDETEPATAKKQPQAKWTAYMDALIKETDGFSKAAGKSDADQGTLKKAYNAVSKACSDCHHDFKEEE